MDLLLFVVLVLASFLGFELISKVPATLHTPLMSGSNAISGITIVGAILVVGETGAPWAKWIGFAALVLATINVVGGFLVTDRMLEMFKPRAAPASAKASASPNGSAR
jgi:NAD(P) transhydrogenase subunit alpha